MNERVDFHRLLLHDDKVVQACMTRLAVRASATDSADEFAEDAAARSLVSWLIQATGGETPDWIRDDGVFPELTRRYLVSYIDAHLRIAPSLSDVARLVGLSPGRFGRRFRQSTGLSLHRFISHRRIKRSLELLRVPAAPLATFSQQLGFASQSHFTRHDLHDARHGPEALQASDAVTATFTWSSALTRHHRIFFPGREDGVSHDEAFARGRVHSRGLGMHACWTGALLWAV